MADPNDPDGWWVYHCRSCDKLIEDCTCPGRSYARAMFSDRVLSDEDQAMLAALLGLEDDGPGVH